MRIAIIGAGNMGGAIARGLAQSGLSAVAASVSSSVPSAGTSAIPAPSAESSGVSSSVAASSSASSTVAASASVLSLAASSAVASPASGASFASSAADSQGSAGSPVAFYELVVANPSRQKLEALQAEYPSVQITQSNVEAVRGADLVLLAVKPWKMEEVARELKPVLDYRTQMVASVAGGVGLADLSTLYRHKNMLPPLFYVMPNTAVAVRQSMTFVAAQGASEEQTAAVVNLFRLLGEAMLVEERLMDGGMALASCGIAFAMRYIRAAMEGGVELGFYPNEAKRIVMQTLRGAVELLQSTGNHPEAEIDRVTTPGGITIRGLNEMEHAGFTDSVIRGLRAARPLKK